MGTEALVLVTIAACFAAGAAAIAMASILPGRRAAAPELWALYRSEFLIVGAVVLPAALGGWTFALALAVFVWRGVTEIFGLFDAPAGGTQQAGAVAAGAALVAAGTLGDLPLLGIAFAAGIASVALLGLFGHGKERAGLALVGAASVAVPGLLAALVAALRAGENGFLWLFLAYATVEIADTSALLFGKLAGRVHPFPRLSPKKTAEGLAAGFAIGGGAGLALAHELLGLTWASSFASVLAILVAGLAGDLLTSAMKRRRGKKDFAPLLRLHGGALDIYDSFLLAAPALFLLRPLLAG